MKKKGSGLPDILVGLVCLSGAALMGYLFWKDLNRTLIKIFEVPVAAITDKHNGAQRRFRERLIWGAVQRGSPVYNGDLIRTADFSDALITFEAGAEIDLSENSLIQIFHDDAGLRLELSGGSVAVDAKDTEVIISSGGREVSVSAGSSVSLDSNSETGDFSIRVAEGNASISTAAGIRKMDAGAALSVAENGRIEEKPQVTVTFPPPGYRVLSGENVPREIPFTFKTTGFGGGEKVRLDIAGDRRFSRTVQSLEGASGTALAARLAPGTWWWRAYAAAAGDAASGDPPDAARGRLYVVYAPAPELRFPAEGERIGCQSAPAEAAGGETRDAPPPVRFRWSSPADGEADAWLLEIADNREMLNPVIARRVEGFSFTSDSLAWGTWYWRVSPLYGGGNQDGVSASGTASFSIVREPAPGESPPALTALDSPKLLSPAGRVSRRPRDSLVFRWQAVPGAEAYSFSLYRGSPGGSFSPPVRESSGLRDTFSSVPQLSLEEGDYYWTVRALAPAGSPYRDSAGESLGFRLENPGRIRLESPAAFGGLDVLRRNARVRWSSPEPAVNARFILSGDSAFRGAPVLSINDPPGSVLLPRLAEGTWYWTVRAENPAGVDISPEAPARFRVLPIPLLGRPGALEPAADSQIDTGYLLRNREALSGEPLSAGILFRWNSVAGANAYVFSLLREGAGEPLVRTPPSPDTACRLRDMASLENGVYLWRVEAVYVAPDGTVEQHGEPAEYRFTLSIPRPGRPVPDSPGILYGFQP